MLAGLLAERGDLDGAEQILRAKADAGNEHAAERLAGLLAERGDLAGPPTRADAGDEHAAGWPACWPSAATRTGRQILRARADAGDEQAARGLAGLLAERGDLDGAEQILRARPTPQRACRRGLAGLLAERGDLDGLRARADAGDG